MIEVKEAAEIAIRYLEDLPSVPAASVRLEEVVLTETEQFWLITLSFVDKTESQGLAVLSGVSGRHYKTFKIDAENGKVLSMKIRQLESA